MLINIRPIVRPDKEKYVKYFPPFGPLEITGIGQFDFEAPIVKVEYRETESFNEDGETVKGDVEYHVDIRVAFSTFEEAKRYDNTEYLESPELFDLDIGAIKIKGLTKKKLAAFEKQKKQEAWESSRKSGYVVTDAIKRRIENEALYDGVEPDFTPWKEAVKELKERTPKP